MNYSRDILHNGIAVVVAVLLVVATLGLIFTLRQPNEATGSSALSLISTATVTQPSATLTPTTGYTPPRSGVIGKIIVSPTPGPPTATPIPTPTPPYSEAIQVKQVIDVEQQFMEAYQAGNLTPLTDKGINVDDIKVSFENWSPDGQYMLLQVKTGEVLEGKNVNDPPGVLKGRVGVYDLWLADIMGIPLYLLAETVFWHSWSPDGTAIAYIHRVVNDGIFDNQLWVMQADGSNSGKLLSNARSVAWLDEQTIIFVDSNTEQLHLIDSDGQNIRPLVIEGLAPENTQVILYELSSDRKKLAFGPRDDTKIRIVDLADDQAELVTEIDVPDFSRMSWSPDSNRLAFSHLCSKPLQKPACQQIHIAQADGKIVTQIAHRPDTNVTWSPDGRWIAFQESNGVYIANTESGEVQRLHLFSVGKQSNTQTVHWSPSGKQIGLNQESTSGATVLSLQITE